MIDQANAARVIQRLAAMEASRAVHDAHWREAFDYSFPERSDYWWQSSGAGSSAQAKRARLVDGTGTDAAKILAAGLVGGLVPSNQQWFDLDTGDPQAVEANDWLSEVGRFLWNAIHASNFDAAAFEVFLDAVIAGWFCLYCEEAADGGLSFEWWPIAEVFSAASRPSGEVDTVYRRYALTVEQAVSEFGLANVSDKVREAYLAGGLKLQDLVQMVHAIERRPESDGNSQMARDLPWASLHVEVDGRHICRESGYHEFPCAVPRWRLIPGSSYAVGPFADVLPDTKTLQALGTSEIRAADMAIGGVWKARDDGVLNPGNIRIGPRKVIAVADMDNLQRLDTSSQHGARQAWTIKADLQAQIRRAMLADYLQPQDKPQMTAYEVHVRVQMIRQLLGPNFGRFQSEFSQPIIRRCFGIAMRAGVLGPPPEGLANYNIQYKSPLARAQKAEDGEAVKGFLGWMAEFQTATGRTDLLDNVDTDKAVRQIGEGSAVPTDVLRDPEELAKYRQAQAAQREQAAQAEQQQAMQMMAAQGAVDKMTQARA